MPGLVVSDDDDDDDDDDSDDDDDDDDDGNNDQNILDIRHMAAKRRKSLPHYKSNDDYVDGEC